MLTLLMPNPMIMCTMCSSLMIRNTTNLVFPIDYCRKLTVLVLEVGWFYSSTFSLGLGWTGGNLESIYVCRKSGEREDRLLHESCHV